MTNYKSKLRNVAIIAHVDHGKTTLVDQLFKQSGLFRDNQVVAERMMDSMDLEKERGITIMSKNGSCHYKEYIINIIDTPGHADFGGEVERVLHMSDGVLLLIDAVDGPMPQSFFVLKKALALNLPVIVVINKIDRPNARCEWVVDQVFDLMVKLNAPDHILDFPVIYASAKEGFATLDYKVRTDNVTELFDMIIKHIPAPKGDPKASLQMLVSSVSYSSFLGRLAIGKITSGAIQVNQDVVIAKDELLSTVARITKLYHFVGTKQVVVDEVKCGDIVAVAGLEHVRVGETITDPKNPLPLPAALVDPPTISMNFLPNDSPFAGLEGEFVTSRHLKERLYREKLSDVAIEVEDLTTEVGYRVSGRGELHLSIFIEKMRREGYEFQVSRPSVIVKQVDGVKMEPFEELTVDVDEAYMGKVIETLGSRRGLLLEVQQNAGLARLIYKIPTRGLLGYQSQFMTETKGMGVMNYVFMEYAPYAGDMRMRKNGAIVVMENCTSVAYALFNLQERGVLFIGPGEKVYEGQVIGEHCREDDLIVNPGKGKKLTNMRSVSSDDAVILTPYTNMSLEQCIAYVNDDELLEITPKSIRLRKLYLTENERRRFHK